MADDAGRDPSFYLVGLRVRGLHARLQDDGRGLNREKILARARERGLVTPEREAFLSDSEVFDFIFEPGFSTAERVTDISGRGVGMDAVRASIQALGGVLSIESEVGVGSRIILKLPLTIAKLESRGSTSSSAA